MGYILPAALPAWRVEIYGLAISMPFVAARVGWIASSAHPVRTFRSREDAEDHVAYVEGRAKWSLVPIRWKGEITQTTRSPDLWDRLLAFFNMRPSCGDMALLYDTRIDA